MYTNPSLVASVPIDKLDHPLKLIGKSMAKSPRQSRIHSMTVVLSIRAINFALVMQRVGAVLPAEEIFTGSGTLGDRPCGLSAPSS